MIYNMVDIFEGEGPLLRLELCAGGAVMPEPCQQCQSAAAENQQLREEKMSLEKQLAKSREDAESMSNLVKDMEHKWTEVAKDYEKQVFIHSDIVYFTYSITFMNFFFFRWHHCTLISKNRRVNWRAFTLPTNNSAIKLKKLWGSFISIVNQLVPNSSGDFIDYLFHF